jgi:PKD domain-containing protein
MKRKVALVLVAGLVLLGIVSPGVAQALAPTNDDFANATVVSSTPFSDSVAIDEATMEVGPESVPCGLPSTEGRTVWYSVTPSSDGALRVINSANFYNQFAAIYRQDGSGFAGLALLDCATWYFGENTAVAQVTAGETYYVQTGSNFATVGTLGVAIDVIEAPTNDDFDDAAAVTTVPAHRSVDTTAATRESGEPDPSCAYGSTGTAWYSFTPAVTDSYSITGSSSSIWPKIAVYTGGSLDSLSYLGCAAYSSPFTFRAEAGLTYYLQVSGIGASGPLAFDVAFAADPVPSFGWNPYDPSIFDTVQFYNNSWDPAGVGISTAAWTFGDGTSGDNPQHRYAKDGDYDVTLTVTTPDGRSASLTQMVRVATHDVEITKVQAAQTANVGQTRQITVGIVNTRYADTVQVRLLKSVAGGNWQEIGVSTQLVPVRGPNRTTSFVFNYTFTAEDKVLGKINFQAIASIQGPRDAALTDNTFISLPTKVN